MAHRISDGVKARPRGGGGKHRLYDTDISLKSLRHHWNACSRTSAAGVSDLPSVIQNLRKRTRRCVKREASPPAHRGARVIGTDALRIVLILREPSDGQERKQDSEDDPNINAHQSSLAAALPAIAL